MCIHRARVEMNAEIATLAIETTTAAMLTPPIRWACDRTSPLTIARCLPARLPPRGKRPISRRVRFCQAQSVRTPSAPTIRPDPFGPPAPKKPLRAALSSGGRARSPVLALVCARLRSPSWSGCRLSRRDCLLVVRSFLCPKSARRTAGRGVARPCAAGLSGDRPLESDAMLLTDDPSVPMPSLPRIKRQRSRATRGRRPR